MKTKAIPLFAVVLILCCCLSCGKEAKAGYWPTTEWKLSTPKKEGMDEKVLEKLASVQDSLPYITSALAVRHGYLVLEKYYEGDADTLRPSYSVAKSITSALIGIAVEQGLIQGIDQKIVDFFPDNANLKLDPRAQEITVRHLLTMSDEIAASENTIQSYFGGPKISRKLKRDPGSRFLYSALSAQAASLILSTVTDKTAFDFGKQYLFEPLGITEISWRKLRIGSSETSNGEDGIKLKSRDLADSTAVQISTDASSDYFRQYGYYWWVHTFNSQPGYFASGWGGQVLCIVLGLDLVAVVTSMPRIEGGELPGFEASIVGSVEAIEKYVIASIKN